MIGGVSALSEEPLNSNQNRALSSLDASARRRHLRATEYRRLASMASLQAQASSLDHVREKHEQAAAQWASLADLDERPLQSRHFLGLATPSFDRQPA